MVSRIRNNKFCFGRIVLHPFSNSVADPCLHIQGRHTALWRVYMERGSDSASAERILLESELRNWFNRQGVSEVGAARAVQLLDASSLLAQPRPSSWNRRGQFGVQERCRYLWYRHAARILGWCDRRRFPDLVTGILRGHAFPTEVVCDEATGEAGKGSVAAGTHSRPLRIDADQISAGQYSCTWTHIA